MKTKEAVPMVLELRDWSLNDDHILAHILNHVDTKYMGEPIPYPYPESDARWWLYSIRKQDGDEGVFRAIVYDGKCVGHICITKMEEDPAIGEIQYCLMREYQNQGIMSKACSMLCQMAFDTLDIESIVARIHIKNVASIHVLRRNGFCCIQTENNICIYQKTQTKS